MVRARAPQSSGQGVSRRAYQTAYRLGNRGTGATGPLDDMSIRPTKFPKATQALPQRQVKDYAKATPIADPQASPSLTDWLRKK